MGATTPLNPQTTYTEKGNTPGEYVKTPLEAALGYASRGWAVFPLAPGSKVPAIPKADGGNGFKDATTDPDDIEAWWAKWPDANVGLPCQGFDVLDLDGEAGLKWLELMEAQHGPLPHGPRQRTPRGGLHILFRPTGYSVAYIRKGEVDWRADGNFYIVAEPSSTPVGSYRWEVDPSTTAIPPAPDWLVDLLRPKEHARVVEFPITEGSRNADLFSLGGSLRARGADDESISITLHALNDGGRVIPRLAPREVDAIIESICGYPPGTPWPQMFVPATIPDPDPDSYHPDGERPAQPESILDRFGARLLGELPTDPPPPLVLDRLAPDNHTILFGPGGVGKGTLASWWIVRLVEAGEKVLILDYENHPGEWGRRITALARDPDLVSTSILHVPAVAGVAIWETAEGFRELADAFGATWVVIDSLTYACGGADAIIPATTVLYSGALGVIGRSVLSIAHTNRAGDLRQPYGSTFWYNQPRVLWSLSREGQRKLLVNRKMAEAEQGAQFSVEVTFRDGLPREVWERPYSVALADQIAELLAEGPMTVTEISGELEGQTGEKVKANTITVTLRRGLREGRFTTTGEKRGARWSLAGEDQG